MDTQTITRQRLLRIALHSLLLVSLLFSGSYFLMGCFYEQLQGLVAAHPERISPTMQIAFEQQFQTPNWFMKVTAVLNALSLAGLVLMWRLRKNGFHCYALSKLALMLLPTLVLGRSYLHYGDVMLGLLIIAWYFRLLHRLGAFVRKEVPMEVPDEEN